MSAKQTNPKFQHYDNLFEAIVIVDKNLKLQYFNNYFSMFSKHPPRLLKKLENFNDIFIETSEDLKAFFNESITKKDISLSKECKVRFKNDDESKVIVIKFIPTIDEDYFLICFNDLSVENHLYDKYRDQVEELKRTHTQILQADKLSTLGELTAGISHEISNPLTIANGNVELLEMVVTDEKADMNEKRDKLIKTAGNIKDAINRIRLIIADMKAFLHKSEEKKDYQRFDDILTTSINLVKPSYMSACIDIESEIAESDLVGLVNRIKIEQVLVNLLKNALDAIKESKTPDGKVIVRLSRDPDEQYINVTVEDNGPGIPSEVQQEIFELFFTTKDVGKGTGIGLSISSKIIDAHQGKLFIEKSDKDGTTFKMQLPAIEVSSYANNEMFLAGINDEEGKRILVVDNEVEVLNVLNRFFEEEGYVFIGSTNGPEALKFLKDVDVDLIITDYEMPLMTGTEFSKEVRDKGHKEPILYLTSKEHVKHFNEDKDALQISGVILKPFGKEQIIKSIDLALSEEK